MSWNDGNNCENNSLMYIYSIHSIRNKIFVGVHFVQTSLNAKQSLIRNELGCKLSPSVILISCGIFYGNMVLCAFPYNEFGGTFWVKNTHEKVHIPVPPPPSLIEVY